MRKKIIDQAQPKPTAANHGFLDLEQLAQVEITSEDETHPVEAAFTSDRGEGWLAAQPGEQTIRLMFDAPQDIKRIQLLFREQEQERTQEFLLRWLPAGGQSYQEIVRQPYNFSPPHTTQEVEEYTVNLSAVSALELIIIPDINNGSTRASLAQFLLFAD